jgi:L-amino acid N-acyltransferase YncA
MMAECMPSATWWVGVISMSVKPAVSRPCRWTLQTAIFTQNRASIALHHQAGYRTVGIRERLAQLHGVWHDTVLIERRTDTVTCPR